MRKELSKLAQADLDAYRLKGGTEQERASGGASIAQENDMEKHITERVDNASS